MKNFRKFVLSVLILTLILSCFVGCNDAKNIIKDKLDEVLPTETSLNQLDGTVWKITEANSIVSAAGIEKDYFILKEDDTLYIAHYDSTILKTKKASSMITSSLNNYKTSINGDNLEIKDRDTIYIKATKVDSPTPEQIKEAIQP